MQCSSFIEISISIEFPVFQENRKIQDRKTGKYMKTGNSIDIEISINEEQEQENTGKQEIL